MMLRPLRSYSSARSPRSTAAVIAVGLLVLAPSTAPSDIGAPVTAAGRGAPWINMRDGVAIPINVEQDGLSAVAAPLGPPRALAAGDFDGNGVPDLVSAYGDGAGGVAVLHRGNVDALYPNSRAARARGRVTAAPFLAARSFPLPVAPDFVGSGDFDADGHVDLVVARRGARAVFWLAGDARGRFGAPQRVELPGTVTALATGEVNLRDGLTDVAIGIAGTQGPHVLVFESPGWRC